MRIAHDRQICEIGPAVLGSVGAQIILHDESAQSMEKLHIEQMGRVQVCVGREEFDQSRDPGPSRKDCKDRRSVDDEHVSGDRARSAPRLRSLMC